MSLAEAGAGRFASGRGPALDRSLLLRGPCGPRAVDCRTASSAVGHHGADFTWLPNATTITFRLGRLSADLTTRLARSLLGERIIPAGLLNQIATRTDGVPLFIEEVTRSLIERVANTGRPTMGDEEGQIPASLHEALIGRLDRTAGAKLTTQVASVAGRLVRLDVLTAVSGMSPDELERSVAALIAAGVIERDLSAPVETYAFSHSLLRDAAYDSLLRDRRRELHGRDARALQKLLPEIQRQPTTRMQRSSPPTAGSGRGYCVAVARPIRATKNSGRPITMKVMGEYEPTGRGPRRTAF
jgi:hypothetical protein